MHGLGDLTAQEPEEEMTDTLTLWREEEEGFFIRTSVHKHVQIVRDRGDE